MQVYLQYKYYITVTKTGDGTPYRSHEYVLLRFRGNVVMKMGTQQQHNNQDRYVNELVPPRTWTLGSVWVQSGVLPKKFGHKLFLSLSAQLDNV